MNPLEKLQIILVLTDEIVREAEKMTFPEYLRFRFDAREKATASEKLHVENEYIFSINGKPPTERSVATLYEKYCKKMGIERKSSHKARKTYVSSLIDGGVNINTVRESAGHSSERTTLKNYTFDRSGEEEKKERFEKALAV